MNLFILKMQTSSHQKKYEHESNKNQETTTNISTITNLTDTIDTCSVSNEILSGRQIDSCPRPKRHRHEITYTISPENKPKISNKKARMLTVTKNSVKNTNSMITQTTNINEHAKDEIEMNTVTTSINEHKKET